MFPVSKQLMSGNVDLHLPLGNLNHVVYHSMDERGPDEVQPCPRRERHIASGRGQRLERDAESNRFAALKRRTTLLNEEFAGHLAPKESKLTNCGSPTLLSPASVRAEFFRLKALLFASTPLQTRQKYGMDSQVVLRLVPTPPRSIVFHRLGDVFLDSVQRH